MVAPMFIFKRAHRTRVQKKNSASAEAVLQKLNSFLDEAAPKLAQLLYRLYQNQQNAVTYKELREAMLDGYEQEIQQWQEEYADFVNEHIYPALIEAMKAGAKQIEEKAGMQFFDDTDKDVKQWIQDHGAEFVTNEGNEISQAIKAILFKGQDEMWTAAKMARYIRPVIGLTRPDALTNAKYQQKVFDTLRENHPRMTEESAAKKAHEAALKYAAKQHRRRADMIANTELAFAYNRGTHESARQAMRDGLMGPCEKVWITAGTERVCSHCAALNGTVVGFEDSFNIPGKELFRGMHQTPPAHPRCRCAVQYREITPSLRAGTADGNTTAAGKPELLGTIDFEDKDLVKKTVKYFEGQIVTQPVENAIIFLPNGNVYRCVGDLNNVTIKAGEGESLEGAIVTHNHPVGSENEYSFSDDDIKFFVQENLAILRGVDEKFVYELNHTKPQKLDLLNDSPKLYEAMADNSLARHSYVTNKARNWL